MTFVRSRLIAPDGTARARVPVTVQIYARPPWTSDKTSCVVGTAATHTGQDGWWEIDIVPFERLEGEPAYTYAKVCEHLPTETVIHWLRVPDSPQPLLMRDLLIEEPTALPPWRPVPTLGLLANVDPAVDAAPGGTTLVRTGHRWGAADLVTTLAALGDVDAESLAAARHGEPIVKLASGRWGVQILSADIALDPGDPTRMTVMVTLGRRIDGKPTVVGWGDGGDDKPIIEGQTLRNTYHDADSYAVTVRYTDNSDIIRKIMTVGEPAGGAG